VGFSDEAVGVARVFSRAGDAETGGDGAYHAWDRLSASRRVRRLASTGAVWASVVLIRPPPSTVTGFSCTTNTEPG
jgi:hypothetical protein